ncbi:DNA ligase D [Shouchella shacheensis]|uniref:DNA ligase D n=1 Tax=Shouchella shacheensis TaxID=1649580 RepID=UPI000AEDB446|nr:DNA ligase D [Shouchella shacheensis]
MTFIKLTEVEAWPKSRGWMFEPKFDGYRASVTLTKESLSLVTRGGHDVSAKFPEVVTACKELARAERDRLPLVLDGELVFLTSPYASDFPTVQKRSRMSQQARICHEAENKPCQFVAFDLLRENGETLMQLPFSTRRTRLTQLFAKPLPSSLLLAPHSGDAKGLFERIQYYGGEGIVCKKKNSLYVPNMRSNDWLKVKHRRFVRVIVNLFDEKNGYFHGSVYDEEGSLIVVAIFRHGVEEEAYRTLKTFFQTNGSQTNEGLSLPPSVCVELSCIGMTGGQLREVAFSRFQLEQAPTEVTLSRLREDLHPLPPDVKVTSLDKPLWEGIDKQTYLHYLQAVAPYMLPFLKERALTVIRYPHGAVGGERFYQKNCPDYAPSYVETVRLEGIDYIVCSDPRTLTWLGNQLALELHIPFQEAKDTKPSELVFDLDPPTEASFELAIEAASLLRETLQHFSLPSFVKTTGGKGLQLHVPLKRNAFSYEETHTFMAFVARFLCEQSSAHFTTERLKKKRGSRLYVDYLQHGHGKTVIAPYSMRESGYVATPISWEELSSGIRPEDFPLSAVLERIRKTFDPFFYYEEARANETFAHALERMKA